MKRKQIKIFGIGFFLGMLGLSFASCSDDHFSDANNGTGNKLNQTIWATLTQQNEVDSFKMILEKAYVMNAQTDKAFNYTYADMLNGQQKYTVLAPINNSYDAKSILDKLDQAATFNADGNIEEAQKLYFQVSQEFIKNHITRFGRSDAEAKNIITMLNSKTVLFDPLQQKFNNIAILKTTDTENGYLYQIEKASPFLKNIYEYVFNNEASSQFRKYMAQYDTLYFNEYASIPGAIYNGRIQYIDSVWVKSNNWFSGFTSLEDSTYVALLPTNEAMNKFFKIYGEYIKLKPKYKSNWSPATQFSQGRFADTETLEPNVMDSIQKRASYGMIKYLMTYSTSRFDIKDQRDSLEIINYIQEADSLVSLNGINLYKSALSQKNDLFTQVNPIRLSNGLLFQVDDYNINAKTWLVNRDFYFDRKYKEAEIVNLKDFDQSHFVSLNELNLDTTVVGVDTVKKELNFWQLVPKSRNGTVEIRLSGLYSTKYKIGVIFAPPVINRDENQKGEMAKMKGEVRFSLIDDEDKPIVGKIGDKEYKISPTINIGGGDTAKIDTVWIFDEVKIPYVYNATILPKDIYSFVRLKIALGGPRSSYQFPLNIVGVLVRPIDLKE